MSMAILLAGSFTTTLLAVFALGASLTAAVYIGTDAQTSPQRGHSSSRIRWARTSQVIAVGTLAFFGLLAASISGFEAVGERRADRDRAVRQALYEECLDRTTAAVCELHWVRLSESGRDDGDGPSIVLTPDGQVGMELGS